MPLTLTAASTALFSTWFFIEELGLLFDAGDGVAAVLAQKSRKIRHIFISHADRDHVCGLLQLHQLNARDGAPHICYPKDCGSFPALRAFMEKFDPQSGPSAWSGLQPGDSVRLDATHTVLAEVSDHIATHEQTCKALRFSLKHTRRILRAEYQGLDGAEIGRLRKALGNEAITEEKTESILGYSGDASGLDPDAWAGVKVLIHECTFLEADTARRAHSDLPQVLQAASNMSLDALVLAHFSARYETAQITEAIQREASRMRLPFPVYAVLPGIISRDLLRGSPVWSPASPDHA